MESMLKWADYLVIGIVLMISAGIGVYYRFTGGKQKTAEEYFSANRSMGIVPLGIALMVSFVSAISILGISAEVYAYGTFFVVHYLGTLVATVVVAYLYLPVFFELNTVSVYEYLERRFGLAARLATSMANFIQLTLYTGVVLYAPSLAVEATTGLSSRTSVILIAVICVFYSSIGGIKAVLVTDIFQAILMFGSLVCIMLVASKEIDGGISNVFEIARQDGRMNFNEFRIDPTIRQNWWCLVSVGFCLFCSLYGVNQVEVQRLQTVKSLGAARLALFLNLPLLVSFGLCTSFCGLVFYAVYRNCDPVRSGQIASADRIMPHFAATKMSAYPGLTGLFIAGIFSASLSTISAMLNSLAAIFLEDYLKRAYKYMGRTFPAERTTLIGKALSVGNGCACVAVAFLAESMGSLVEMSLSITGSIAGPVLGIFTLGLFFEIANEKGAIAGMLSGLIICMWASFGQPRPKFTPLPVSTDGCNSTLLGNITLPTTRSSSSSSSTGDQQEYFYLYRISYLWYSQMGLTVTLVVGLLCSLLVRWTSRTPQLEPEPALFTPFLAQRIRRRRADAARTTASQVLTLDEPPVLPRPRKPQ